MLRAILIIFAVTAFSQRVEPSEERERPDAAAYPTKAGIYRHKGWRYEYTIENGGTRSERRIGRLFLDDDEVIGKAGELRQESFGRFIYFGTTGYNRGWLNTLTYDEPVFDDSGSLTSAASQLLRDKTE